MSLRIRFTPESEADLAESRLWYEEAQDGLGDRFLAAVRLALSFVSDRPTASREVENGIRRVLVREFPYALYYVAEEAEIVVLGCFHARRSPSAWRIRGRPLP